MPEPIRTRLDHKIRVRLDDLPSELGNPIIEALTIPNLEKLNAKKQHIWGWERMPDDIPLYEIEGDDLVMPRGFAKFYAEGVRLSGYKIAWEEGRTWNPIFKLGNVIEPRAWQEPAIQAMMKSHQGIYKAPAGSGKTVAILETVRRLGCQSIVIVNTKDILWQWQDRAQDFLGTDYPLGQIGDGRFDVSPYMTIATAQTLHSRFDEIEKEGFFDQFSFVCLDECHHATADTYNRVLDRFSARYRLGVSATPDKTGDFALATCVLGPIIHETKPDDVDALMKPEVIRVPTKFGFGFRGTKSRWQRSNYPQMIQALITDIDRNNLIVSAIAENKGHHQLVLSKRLEHLAILEDMLFDHPEFDDPIVTITGKDDNEHRQQAKLLAETSPCVVLSTLADEALDIPRLDRAHLTFPQRNSGLVTQQVGRVERIHDEKTDALIFDYCDMNVGPLEKQWRIRRFEVYEPRGYKITTRKADTFA